jgi:eukaryotic-like serine/threonine-protein kinase
LKRVTSPRPGIPAALSERYQLRREIGVGGMAVVLEAWDTRQERVVAVKVMRPELVSASLADRFQREIAVAANLVHPHIVPIYDAGVEGHTLYFVMPLLQGGTLRERLVNDGAQPIAFVRRLADQIGSALHFAHEQGLVHRDVKPENLLLTPGGAMLGDFGIARSGSLPPPGMSTTGGFIGTPTYASPEQLAATSPAGPPSDQYSLACVLFEALTGRPPFVADNAADLVVAHCTAPVPSAAELRPDIPAAMDAALQRAMAKAPEERFESCAAFVDAFTDFASVSYATVEARRPVVRSGRRAAFAAVALAVLAAALYAAGVFDGLRQTDSPLSIAVLPCANFSGDPQQEYFSDGVTEQVIAQLSTLPNLRVINMLSVLRYKGSTKAARDVGKDLDADLLVQCSANRQAEGVRISAQLVDARTENVLLTRTYTASGQDILQPQLDAALDIAEAMSITLSSRGRRRLSSMGTQSDSAWQLYMRGRHAWNVGTLDGLQRSLLLLRQATEEDSSFALAWAGVADAHLSLVGRWMARGAPQYDSARVAIEQALAARSDLGEALAARGRLHHRANWNFTRARDDLRAARRASPSSWQPWLDHAKLESVQGRHDPAIMLARTAVGLDPLNAINVLGLAEILYFARRYDEALAQVDRAIELEPTFAFNHLWRSMILLGMRRPQEAAVSAREATRLAQRHPGTLAILARAEAESGRPATARTILAEMDRASAVAYVPPTLVAVVHMGLGETNDAVAALTRAVEERDWFISELAVHPLADPVRDNPRVRSLLQRMGLDRVPAPVPVSAPARAGSN